MQKSKEKKGYKRENSMILQSLTLAFTTMICCVIGAEFFRFQYKLEKERVENEIKCRNEKIIQIVKAGKEKMEQEKLEIAKAKVKEETTKKNVIPSAVTYTSEEESDKKEVENAPTTYQKVLEVNATAYCLCKKCCGKSEDHPEYGVTRSGLKIVPGTGMKVIAVDPKVIPLGSKVYVEGVNGVSDYGYAVAADTGGAIKNNKIDLYMESHEETINWGIRQMKVYIVE